MSATRIARRCFGLKAALCALLASAGCDPSVFDIPDAEVARDRSERSRVPDAGERMDAGPASTNAGKAGTRPSSVGAGGAANDSGQAAGAQDAAIAVANGGEAGTSETAGMAGAGGANLPVRPGRTGGQAGVAGVSGMDAAAVSGAGGAGGAGGQDTTPTFPALHVLSCPMLASAQSGEFCYDFELGPKGPDDGDAYELWDTPENATPATLDTQELPAGSGNHVLFVAPALTGMYPSATIGHDTPRLTHAIASFDFWANDTLLNVENDVVFFRYLPDERDYDHVTELFFRGGAAWLRTEAGDGKELRFARGPVPNDKTHVSIELDRAESCSVRVLLDDALVVSADAVRCGAVAGLGFVEYGLVVLDGPGSSISALYDNIALDTE